VAVWAARASLVVEAVSFLGGQGRNVSLGTEAVLLQRNATPAGRGQRRSYEEKLFVSWAYSNEVRRAWIESLGVRAWGRTKG